MSDTPKPASGADTALVRALKRGASIEMTDNGWRLRHEDGTRGRKVLVAEFADLADSGRIVRTDDRKSRIGETWALKRAYSPSPTPKE
jgi:hypothetical protein